MSCPAVDLNPPDCPACIVIPRGPGGSAGRRYLLTVLTPEGTAQDMTPPATLVFEVTPGYGPKVVVLSYAIVFATPTNGLGILTIPSGAFPAPTTPGTGFSAGTEYDWAVWLTLGADAASPYLQQRGTLRVENVA